MLSQIVHLLGIFTLSGDKYDVSNYTYMIVVKIFGFTRIEKKSDEVKQYHQL